MGALAVRENRAGAFRGDDVVVVGHHAYTKKYARKRGKLSSLELKINEQISF